MMVHQESLRVFCAAEIPDEENQRVAEYASHLRSRFPDVVARWERTEKLHVTLKFFGEISPPRIEELSRAVARAADGVAPFSLVVEGTGFFPPRGAARVLWLGVGDESDGLHELQRRVEDECATAGAASFAREPRPFRPHLTIARLRTPRGARAIADAHRGSSFRGEAFTVSELVVMRSEITAGGSRYSTLSRHPLQR